MFKDWRWSVDEAADAPSVSFLFSVKNINKYSYELIKLINHPTPLILIFKSKKNYD